jgi:hypothetical protein
MLNCTLCFHPCHCKGVGQYVNTNQCIGYDCNCNTCTHPIEEDSMIKKIKEFFKRLMFWTR